MILVTVGTELPFDRLVRAVDDWARHAGRSDVFAQIGEGAWRPTQFPFSHFVEPGRFHELFRSADLVIGHAGMGTILSALQYGKPLIVMPRRASLGEQRNEHQLATARRLREAGRVNVAIDEAELRSKLDRLDAITAADNPIGPDANDELLSALRSFIHGS